MISEKKRPPKLPGKDYYFDSFANDQRLLGKKKGHLPAMGWNSWNAFGSGNTALLTKAMADKIVELGLDEFSGLEKGWNDPDMMMIGMNGLNDIMCRTHMVMWCMMNSPLMLGLDLRRVQKGDALWNIIANKELIALNQDALGVQAKRVYTTIETDYPDTDYITNDKRCDILVKPLADGSAAVSFINVNEKAWDGELGVSTELIVEKLGKKMVDAERFVKASGYMVKDLWTGEVTENRTGYFVVNHLDACESITIRVTPIQE